jgi:integrase
LTSLLASDSEVFVIVVEGKGRKTRPVVIGRDILQQMSEYFHGARADSLETCRARDEGKDEYERSKTYFFLNHFDGRPISDHSTREAIKNAGAAAGMIDITPHTLRHWYATSRLRQRSAELQNGRVNPIPDEEFLAVLEAEIAAIREDLGHALASTTMIYLRSFLRQMANRVAVKHQQQSVDRLKARRAEQHTALERAMAV